jgi:acyl-CoA reductase-like NAD-dependent aldehyde dehydrogenase
MRSVEAIADEALSLPANERAALVLRLAESLDEQHDNDAEDAWAEAVTERIEALNAGTAEAAAWYDERVSGLGDRFLSEAEAAFARIDATPGVGPPWTHPRLPAGVRRMFLRSFPC